MPVTLSRRQERMTATSPMGKLLKRITSKKTAAPSKQRELDDGMISISTTFTCASITESECEETPVHGCLTIRTQEKSLRVSTPIRTSASSQNKASMASVQFSTVQVRVYPTILSDQPQCTSGPPIGIGWEHDASLTTLWDVEEHQYYANPLNVNRQSKIAKRSLVLSSWRRERILLSHGYSQAELDAAANAAEVVRQQRQISLEQGDSSSSVLAPVMTYLFKSSTKASNVESVKTATKSNTDKNQSRKLADQLY